MNRSHSCSVAGRGATAFLILGWLAGASPKAQAQFLADSIPSQSYYGAIEEIFRGDYRNAERALKREALHPIRIGAPNRWIDSICYQALWGEVLYHEGRLAQAMDHYTEACNLFLQYPDWMLKLDFHGDPRIDTSRARRVVPWGTSSRQVTLGDPIDAVNIAFGDSLLQQQQAATTGGVIRQAQYWRVNAVEIVRATALAMSRRNELLGPLAESDPLNRDLMNQLVSGIAPPNHWSNAWADLLLGIAYAGQGNYDLAISRLQRAERLQGRFDYRLTCMALLEQGRAAFAAGKTQLADNLFAEASYSAYFYDNPGVIDEAFRLASQNRLGSPQFSPNPSLDIAAAWARRERYDHIFARLCFARSEEWMNLGDWNQASGVLKQGQSQLKRNQGGLLGVWSRYLEARVLTSARQATADAVLNAAIADQIATSKSLFQLGLANQWYDRRQVRASVAAEVYQTLLADPSPSDWAYEPLDSLARLKASLEPSFDRWIEALTEGRKPLDALLACDLAKRHRFFLSLEMGGRIAALRKTLETPRSQLSPAEENLRDDLRRRYPVYSELLSSGNELHSQLLRLWQPALPDEGRREVDQLLRKFADNLSSRANILTQLGLGRVPCNFRFPPIVDVDELQVFLAPGQAVAVFHETAEGIRGYLVTSRASTNWDCGPSGHLMGVVNEFLRDLGNHDRNSTLDEKQLAEEPWLESGRELYDALFRGSSIDPASLDELIVVPDGVVWYVPMEALPVKLEGKTVPLSSLSRVRTVPTFGLAFGQAVPWRRVQHASVIGAGIVPGEKDDVRAAALAPLAETLTNRIDFPQNPPVPSPVLSTLLDEMLVLDESDIELEDPLAWNPIPGRKDGDAGMLANWTELPPLGPQRMIFPATHTIAENAGRMGRKRREAGPPGSELFLSSCGLMSSGAQTILLSRWRVGGQSTLDLMREFVQELPRTSAADAWQRCIEVAKVLPLKVSLEPRVKIKLEGETPTAAHPLFWAGYLLIDAGEPLEPAASVAEAPEKPAS